MDEHNVPGSLYITDKKRKCHVAAWMSFSLSPLSFRGFDHLCLTVHKSYISNINNGVETSVYINFPNNYVTEFFLKLCNK